MLDCFQTLRSIFGVVRGARGAVVGVVSVVGLVGLVGRVRPVRQMETGNSTNTNINSTKPCRCRILQQRLQLNRVVAVARFIRTDDTISLSKDTVSLRLSEAEH